jgi:polyisoprenoid-binding protein YceI
MRLSRILSRATLFATIAAVAWGVSADARATTFRSGENACNIVSFRSKAPLETITGKTSKAHAAVMVGNLDDLAKDLSASITVDLASLDTDIALRDQHMRDQYLETEKHPNAVFTLDEVVSAYTTSEPDGQGAHTAVDGLQAGVETHVVIKGTLELHGEKHDITVDDLAITYYPQGAESQAVFRNDDGDMLIVSGSVGVKLSDYSIKRPQFVLLKLSDDVRVSFSVSLSSGVAGGDGESMAGCGGCGGCGDGACGG